VSANEALTKTGGEQIGKVTPHSLRRTFASLLLATGADVPYASWPSWGTPTRR
jgi:integrase